MGESWRGELQLYLIVDLGVDTRLMARIGFSCFVVIRQFGQNLK